MRRRMQGPAVDISMRHRPPKTKASTKRLHRSPPNSLIRDIVEGRQGRGQLDFPPEHSWQSIMRKRHTVRAALKLACKDRGLHFPKKGVDSRIESSDPTMAYVSRWIRVADLVRVDASEVRSLQAGARYTLGPGDRPTIAGAGWESDWILFRDLRGNNQEESPGSRATLHRCGVWTNR